MIAYFIIDFRITNGRNSRLLRSRSGAESPRSLDSVRSRQIPSPLRTPRSVSVLPKEMQKKKEDVTAYLDISRYNLDFRFHLPVLIRAMTQPSGSTVPPSSTCFKTLSLLRLCS